MEQRIKLFEKYTLDSIRRQTSQNFTWAIFFDPQTPDEIVNRWKATNIEAIKSGDPIGGCTKGLFNDRLLTTRLDNDDYLETYYVEAVQKIAARVQVDTVIDFHGRALDHHSGVYYDPKRASPTSMFLSLVEFGEIKTALGHEHSKMKSHYPAIFDDRYGWVMVCHGDNQMNKIEDYMDRNVPQERYI